MHNESLNTYMAFRTAPLMFYLQSMTSYSIQLILMLYRYSGVRRSKEEIDKYKKRCVLIYWGIFVIYMGLWFLIWRLCVSQEQIKAMDWIISLIYVAYLVFQVQLVRKLYSQLKISMKPVVEKASCLLFMVKFIIMLHVGLRIVFNVLSDSSSINQGSTGQQISWMYILLGDGITEMFSAFGMILLMVITYTFEADAKQYLH
jgi:hypothetical protein